MLHVESAKYQSDFKIEGTFNDGASHLVDFEKTVFNDSSSKKKAEPSDSAVLICIIAYFILI